jgi:hypothetical protein
MTMRTGALDGAGKGIGVSCLLGGDDIDCAGAVSDVVVGVVGVLQATVAVSITTTTIPVTKAAVGLFTAVRRRSMCIGVDS